MKDKIAIIIPTRERLDDLVLFAESWKNTSEGLSDVILGIDDDDSTYNELIENKNYPFIWEIGKQRPFLHILNELAYKYSQTYNYVAFLEDDVIIHTPKWESQIIDKIKELGDNAIVWCNDWINGPNLVNMAFMNSNIVRKLGYMVTPGLKTMVADVYWMDLGKKLNKLHYFENIIIEHRHYILGKRKFDNTSYLADLYLQEDRDYRESNEYKNKLEEEYLKLII